MENVGSVAWETWKIAEETKTTMQKLLARYSDFQRFCLQRRKETREIDSAARKLETNRKLAVSINAEKNYMQDDDGGNKKNAASSHLHRLRLLLLDRIWIAVGYVR